MNKTEINKAARLIDEWAEFQMKMAAKVDADEVLYKCDYGEWRIDVQLMKKKAPNDTDEAGTKRVHFTAEKRQKPASKPLNNADGL